jgi:hypothetical protein
MVQVDGYFHESHCKFAYGPRRTKVGKFQSARTYAEGQTQAWYVLDLQHFPGETSNLAITVCSMVQLPHTGDEMRQEEHQVTEEFAISARRYADTAARFGAHGIDLLLIEEAEVALKRTVAAFEALKSRIGHTVGAHQRAI